MHYREIRTKQNEEIRERYDLCMERIGEIPDEAPDTPEGRYFGKMAAVLMQTAEILSQWEADTLSRRDLAVCREWKTKS